MPFPEVKRTIYNKNPLVEVVCQLRFPAILKLKKQIPDSLQETINDKFPYLEEVETTVVRVNSRGSDPTRDVDRIYRFYNKDKSEHFTVCYDFIAFTSNNYQCWETFVGNAQFVFQVFCEIYGVNVFTRTGLRYKNVISPSMLEKEKIDWVSYIKPALSGCFSDPQINKDKIKDYAGKLLIDIDDKSQLQSNYALVESMNDPPEIGFLIDNDFFTVAGYEIEGLDNAITKLEDYKRRSHDFFRWCITDELHQELEPQEQEGD